MHRNELSIPPTVAADLQSHELARIWVTQGSQHVSIATGVWDDPAAWGIMLVDLAKHIANSYVQTQGLEVDAVLDRIREGFDAEWQSPTDEPRGTLMDKP